MKLNLILFVTFFPLLTGYSKPLPKHWHQSGGFGTNTDGGLGGKVIKVTNLNNSGSGSLINALNQSGKRLIVFEVGGVIDLEGGRINISKGEVTIAGQTAPKPGITIIRGDFIASGNDIVVSHIAVRLGDEDTGGKDAADILGDNVVFDHVAVSWGVDEGLSISGASNVTLYKCYIAEGLSRSSAHPEDEHSKGSLIQRGTNKLSLIGTLYAFNCLRSPRLHSSAQAAMLNSVIYGWAPGKDDSPQDYHYLISLASATMSVVGNVALMGPQSIGEYLVSGHKGRKASVYMKDNIILDMEGKALYEHDENITPLESPPLWPPDFKAAPAHEAVYEVLRTVGPRPGDRDPIDARTVGHVADGTGKIIDSQNDVGGYPDYPETKRPIQVPAGKEAQRKWLDAMENEFAVDEKIDLSRIYPQVGSIASDKFGPGGTSSLKGNTKPFNAQIVQNPSSNVIHADFSLQNASEVHLAVYNLSGNQVAISMPKRFSAGRHSIPLDVGRLHPGLYICRLRVGDTTQNLLYRRF